MDTLSERLSDSNNALNTVRLALATLVIFSHAWPIGGFAGGLSWSDTTAGQMAVAGFFCLSGYLVANSREHLLLATFLWRRALRIFPAFWACLVVTAFVFAPLAALLARQDWSPTSSLSFVTSNANLRIGQWSIDSTLIGSPTSAWNGSLWTLIFELIAYISLGLLFSFKTARKPSSLFALLVLATGLNAAAAGPLSITTNLYLNGLTLAQFFLAGAFLWSLRERVQLRSDWALIAGATTVVLVPLGQFAELAALPLAYLLLWIGATAKVRIGAKNDISYGVYIYAFPVAQLLWLTGVAGPLGPWGYAVLITLCTVPLAWASWLIVERPALRLKRLRAKPERALQQAA